MIRHRRPELLNLPLERCCQLLSLSRSEYYLKAAVEAREPEPEPSVDELEAAVQEVADERSAYGYRRVGAELRRRGRSSATNKRVRSRMRKMGLNRRRKRRKTRTTTPGKGPASPNLAADLTLTGPRQLLVTDLSYVALPLEALEMVLAHEDLPDGWVHHSDRGCQYTSNEYRERVLAVQGLLSNSRSGCPYDNAAMESFFKTYKYEEANFQTFRSLEDFKPNLATFLEDYNSQRLHSSIGYRSPIEFEILHAVSYETFCVR